MEIIVLVKQVPDTETKIKLKAGETKIDKEGINMIINPYDEFAIEEALRIKEKIGDVTVTLVGMGPKKAEEALRTGLAMGADKAVILTDDAFEDADSLATAKTIVKTIKDMPYDLILCGKKAIDDDNAQVAGILAEMLTLPIANMVTKLEISDDKTKAKVTREVEGGKEIMEVSLPAVITAEKGLNEPRYPSLPGIMKAKKKELKIVDLAGSGLSKDDVGEAGSKIKILDMYLPPARQTGKKLEGEPAETAAQLAKLLREEAKVI